MPPRIGPMSREESSKPLGLIAGSGRFPILVVNEASRRGIPMVVAAIKEEASPQVVNCVAEAGEGFALHWIALGQLGKLIRLFKKSGVEKALMAGQVRHSQIFSPNTPTSRKLLSAMPDLTMLKVLMSLPRKNTESLIQGVVGVLEENGIQLLDSTLFLKDLMAGSGVLTVRPPSAAERNDIEYGRPIARQLARLDLGQSIVVKDCAVVAVEAMEGTDETVERAARLAAGQSLTLIKVARPDQDMRFDVPVLGLDTLEVLAECHVTAVAVEEGRTLFLDKEKFIAGANDFGISIVSGSE